MGAGHISCPCWSAAIAVANQLGSSEQETLAAFITGFEVMARAHYKKAVEVPYVSWSAGSFRSAFATA